MLLRLGRLGLPGALLAAAIGCGPSMHGTTSGATAPSTLTLDLGTVNVGRGETFSVRVPATPTLQRLAADADRIDVHSDVVDLHWKQSGPGWVIFEGTTRHVTPAVSFETSAAAMKGANETVRLKIVSKVRRAFEVSPIEEGKRYALKLAPGFETPVVVERSSGLVGKVVSTGPGTAELVVTRKSPALTPGGVLRLLDRASGDTRPVLLPLPPIPVSSGSSGSLLDRTGRMVVGANSALTPDKPDVQVVLDPPGAYEIEKRGYQNGKLTLTLRSLTRMPADLQIGFRRAGEWVELQRHLVD